MAESIDIAVESPSNTVSGPAFRVRADPANGGPNAHEQSRNGCVAAQQVAGYRLADICPASLNSPCRGDSGTRGTEIGG